jgi:hypothetical protein
MTQQPLKIRGTWIDLSGKRYLLPPMTLGTMRFHGEAIERARKGDLPELEHMDIIVDIIWRTLKRNYPDITVDEVAEGLDVANALEIFLVAQKTSGLTLEEGESTPEKANGQTGTPS